MKFNNEPNTWKIRYIGIKNSDSATSCAEQTHGFRYKKTTLAEFPISDALDIVGTLGGMAGLNSRLVVALATSPVLAVIGESNQEVLGVGFVPDYFRSPLDLPDDTPGSTTSEKLTRLFAMRSLVFDVFQIDDRTVAVLHHNGFNREQKPSEAYGLQVIDVLSGSVLNSDIFIAANSVPGAGGNGFLYSMNIPTDDQALMGATPELVAYRYLGNDH